MPKGEQLSGGEDNSGYELQLPDFEVNRDAVQEMVRNSIAWRVRLLKQDREANAAIDGYPTEVQWSRLHQLSLHEKERRQSSENLDRFAPRTDENATEGWDAFIREVSDQQFAAETDQVER